MIADKMRSCVFKFATYMHIDLSFVTIITILTFLIFITQLINFKFFTYSYYRNCSNPLQQ